ncbi:MAG: pyruvate dehydrogenase complex dihydrolipoamide acetyltransferase, partial [Altererythrobacter sp.]|nr:pyruvate dehydrogenase complex dihydrolipoamide acetyltransferase [Altererythrobacter sp.]
MPIEIKMPALSPTMEEGTLAKWLVKPGDEIRSGDIMAEIETDKATMEFEAVDEGTLVSIAVEEGTENVAVGTVIAVLAEEGEDADAAAAALASAPTSAPSPSDDGPAATPTARKLAEASGIDLASITGTGPNGKITKGDVEAAGGSSAPASAPTPAPAPAPATSGDRIVASPLAKRIAEQKGLDLSTIAGSGPNGRIVKADVEDAKP